MRFKCACGLPGELKFPLNPSYFCPSCFSLKFEKRLLKRIPRYVRGHSIAIALSGGKDSTTLLHVLRKYNQKLRITKLSAIILEEGILEVKSSREKVIKKLKTDYPDVRFLQESYNNLFGVSLPELIQHSEKKGLSFTPCAICGILRRHSLLRLSLEFGVDYIVMGNTLEDEAETVLLNVIRGIPWKNYRDQIDYKPIDGKSLPIRIKPLAMISESSIQEYSSIKKLPIVNTKCPFVNESLRTQISIFLTKMKKKNQNVLYNIVSSKSKEDITKKQVKKVSRCKKCNSYSHQSECSACSLVQQIMS